MRQHPPSSLFNTVHAATSREGTMRSSLKPNIRGFASTSAELFAHVIETGDGL